MLHGIIMVKQDEETAALTYDYQDLSSQSLLDAVREDISHKYKLWVQKEFEANRGSDLIP